VLEFCVRRIDAKWVGIFGVRGGLCMCYDLCYLGVYKWVIVGGGAGAGVSGECTVT
jgi:hypothetical protein